MRDRGAVLGDVEIAGRERSQAPWIAPADRLLLSFLTALATLLVARDAPARAAPIAVVAAAIVVVAVWARRNAAAALLHDFFPAFATIAIFELLGAITPVVNPTAWDATFAALDARWFGRLAAAWFGAFGRPAPLTDAVALAYVAYYVLPIGLGVALYRRDRARFRAFVFVVVATFVTSFAGYLMFPTSGPRVADPAVLGGGAITRAVLAFVHAAEGNTFDAFPSGHTAVALVCVVHGWRLFPGWRSVLALLLAGIVFSTVYLSYHYVVDVVAGAAMAVGVMLVCEAIGQRPSS